MLQGTHNAARRVLDGLNYMSDTLVSVGTKPTKMVSAWVTDKIAPPYWVPNSQITVSRALMALELEKHDLAYHNFVD